MKVRISSNIPLALTLLNAKRIEAFTTTSISSPSSNLIPSPYVPNAPKSSFSPRRSTFLLYGPNSDDNGAEKEAIDKLNSGFWNALEYTEQWISHTLSNPESKSNPHARKELKYVCEMNDHILSAVASIFRRFREAREAGERHSIIEEKKLTRDPSYQRTIFRETQVIIVPFCEYFESFQKFEGVLQAINLARKDAKDFVTDISIEKMETCDGEWNFNINGASLHPHYGEKTPKEIIEELERLEADGEIDINQMEEIKRRNNARRSPYPTLIVELQATPPIPVDASYDPIPSLTDDEDDLTKKGVLKDIVVKLETIFAKSAVLHKKTEIKKSGGEESFYDAIGTVAGVEEVLVSSPILATQQWVIEKDPFYNPYVSTFASANVDHADAAFEFVFTNLAMHKYKPSRGSERKEYKVTSRSYLIMPNFVSSSATSLEKFMSDVRSIVDTIDGLNERISFSLMHPEHIRDEKRSPAPVLVAQWYDEKS